MRFLNSFIKQAINHKINTITSAELIELGLKYKIIITKQEAAMIVKILRRETVDITNDMQRKRILKQIWLEVGPDIQVKIQRLLNELLGLNQ